MNISEQTTSAFEQQPNKVFIGGLSVNCEETELTDFLEKFGPLTKVEVIKDPKTRAHKGYAFATFAQKRDMHRAIGKNHVLKGKQFEIREFVDSNTNSEYLDRIAKRKIFISNIKELITEKDLFEFFSSFGAIEELTISRDATTGLSKGFGFVLFIEEESKKKVLRDYGNSGVRIKGYDLQVKGAIPKKDINKIKQASVLSPLQDGQNGEVSQDYMLRRFDFSERNSYLSGMINVIPDPNPSPVSFMKEGLTPTTYLHSTGSPFTPNPQNKFSFTPEVSPMAMVHPQFNFNQHPQHSLRMPDYHLMPTQQFSKHYQDARLISNNPSHLAWAHDHGDPSPQAQAEFGRLQPSNMEQRMSHPNRHPSPVQDDAGAKLCPKSRKTSHLALKLGKPEKEDRYEGGFVNLPQLSKALCLCSTEAETRSDSTSLFTTLRRFRCSCGEKEAQGTPEAVRKSNPNQESNLLKVSHSNYGQQTLSPDESKRLEKARLENEGLEYNHWQNIKVSKDKLEMLRRRIPSQEGSHLSGLDGSPLDRELTIRKMYSHME